MSDTFPGNDTNPLLNRAAAQMEDAPGQVSAPDPVALDERRMASRTKDLLGALEVVQDEGTILLDELTRRSGRPITLKVRRMAVQELIAADLIPKRALTMAGFMMDQAEERVKNIRKKWNLPEHETPSQEQWAADAWSEQDLLEGAKAYLNIADEKEAERETVSGMYSFLGAVVCACTSEPRLYFDQDALDRARAAGRDGAVVWRIPEPDLWKVMNWALKTEARAVRTNTEPFLGAGKDAGPVEASPSPRVDAGRAGDV